MNSLPFSEALNRASNTQTAGTTVMKTEGGFRIEGSAGAVSGHVRRLGDQGVTPVAVSTVMNRVVAVYNSAQWNEQLHPRDKGKFKTKAELEKEATEKAARAKEALKAGADKSAHQEAGRVKLDEMKAAKSGGASDSSAKEIAGELRSSEFGKAGGEVYGYDNDTGHLTVEGSGFYGVMGGSDHSQSKHTGSGSVAKFLKDKHSVELEHVKTDRLDNQNKNYRFTSYYKVKSGAGQTSLKAMGIKEQKLPKGKGPAANVTRFSDKSEIHTYEDKPGKWVTEYYDKNGNVASEHWSETEHGAHRAHMDLTKSKHAVTPGLKQI